MSARRRTGGSDLLLGVLALVVAAGYLYETSRIPESLPEDAVGAKGLPFAIGWATAGLGLVLCLRSMLVRAPLDADTGTSVDRQHVSSAARRHLAALGLLAILALYVVTLPYAAERAPAATASRVSPVRAA